MEGLSGKLPALPEFAPACEVPEAARVLTCQLGQLEYNPRHHGHEEKEAGWRQKEDSTAQQQSTIERKTAERCHHACGGSASA